MTRQEKIDELYRHLTTVMSAGSAKAAANYVMKIIEAWPPEPDEPGKPDEETELVGEAAAKVMKEHDKTFKKLAESEKVEKKK